MHHQVPPYTIYTLKVHPSAPHLSPLTGPGWLDSCNSAPVLRTLLHGRGDRRRTSKEWKARQGVGKKGTNSVAFTSRVTGWITVAKSHNRQGLHRRTRYRHSTPHTNTPPKYPLPPITPSQHHHHHTTPPQAQSNPKQPRKPNTTTRQKQTNLFHPPPNPTLAPHNTHPSPH